VLLFKKKFLDAIRSGRKTQTVRLWKTCRLRSGGLCYVPGVGYTRISEITKVRLEELTDEDAVLDGFPSAAALLQEIHSLYEEQLRAGYQAFRIRFSVLPADEAAAERDKRKAAKATKAGGTRGG
jgi:hypothetical protein